MEDHKSRFPCHQLRWTRTEAVLIICIIVMATCLRLIGLESVPPGLWYDESINGLDALQIYPGGKFPVFFTTEGHPREPLFMYLIAFLYPVFGISIWTIRAAAGLTGVATIILIHLFTRRLYGPWTGLLAAFFLALSKWHLVFSRSSLRTILTPLILLVVLYFLWLGLAKGHKKHFIWAGAWLGLGAYSYLAFRLVPVLLLLLVLILYWSDRSLFKKRWKLIILMIVVAGIVFSPLAFDYISNPFHYSGRTGQISLFKDGPGSGIIEVFKNTGRVLAMLNIPGLGDHEPKHNYPGDPAMGLIESLLFLTGLIIIIIGWQDRRSQLLFLWLLLFMLPSILSFGAPNTLRTTALIPALAIITAHGLMTSVDYIKTKRGTAGQARLYLIISLALILTTTAFVNINKVFFKWGTSPEVWEKFNSTFSDIGKYIKDNPETRYIIPDVLATHPTFNFVLFPKEPDFSSYQLNRLPLKLPAPETEVICLIPRDVQFVQKYYPANVAMEFRNPFNNNTRAVSFRVTERK